MKLFRCNSNLNFIFLLLCETLSPSESLLTLAGGLGFSLTSLKIHRLTPEWRNERSVSDPVEACKGYDSEGEIRPYYSMA